MRQEHLFVLFLTVLLCTGCTGGRPHKPLIGGITRPMSDHGKARDRTSGEEPQAQTIDSIEIPAPLGDRPEQILRREGYTVSYNRELRIANWVAWHLTAEHTGGQHKRQGMAYMEDTEVPAPRATTYDYQQSGYDRGHMCPSADNRWSSKAQQDCFLLTNMCPQNHSLNGGDWNDLEMACRRWAQAYGDLYIVCGPVPCSQKRKTIGRNKITVPEAFFKVVLRLRGEPEALGFVYQNTGRRQDAYDCVRSVDEIERLTAIDFFPALDDSTEKRVEAETRIASWSPAYPELRH